MDKPESRSAERAVLMHKKSSALVDRMEESQSSVLQGLLKQRDQLLENEYQKLDNFNSGDKRHSAFTRTGTSFLAKTTSHGLL